MRVLMLVLLLAQTAGEKEAERLKDLAAKADTGPAKVAAADAYLTSSKKFAKERSKFLEKGMELYEAAWPTLDDAWKMKLREKLHLMSGFPKDYEKQKKEVAPSGWTGFRESSGSFLEEKFGAAGARSGKVMTWKDPNGRNSWLTSVKIRVQAGKEFEFSGRIFSERADAPGEFHLRFYDQENKSISQVGPTVDPDLPLWKKYAVTGKIPEGAMWADICLWSTLKSGAFWMDEVAVMVDGKNIVRNGGFEDR